MKDRDVIFHKKWLGYAEPIEGLVFSVPALADAQIAPEEQKDLSTAFDAQLVLGPAPTGPDADKKKREPIEPPRIRSIETFFRDFLGYSQPGMLVPRTELPADLVFYAAEGQQEIRPTFALGRGPFKSDDPFAAFEETPKSTTPADPNAKPWFALVWDLGADARPRELGALTAEPIDLDAPEAVTGPWRYPPTAKLERLLRHTGIPVGFLFNGQHLRLVYAPVGESTAHLTFRAEHMRGAEGRTLLTALDLLLHARRQHTAAPEHTLEGLLGESRRRQADVTEELAKQVFEAVESLLAGFEAAATRDCGGDKLDWLRPALEAEGDHFYQGVLSVVLRLVFLLYAEDQGLLPVEHKTYAQHLSLSGLYARLSHDAGAHPESMHHRFGAYGQLLALFRAVFFGVKHGSLELPPRRGRLFDPNAYPFLEGGLPEWTAAVVDPAARAEARPPSIDDGTIYRMMHRLVVFAGQRLSYRTLDVEQIGSVYESLMGYHVVRTASHAVRIGKHGVWVESEALRRMTPSDRSRYLKETCGLNPGPATAIEKVVRAAGADDQALVEGLCEHTVGKKSEQPRHSVGALRLVLQPGDERRRTGSHYTPRSLTDKVVKRTLEPLLACLGEDRTPDKILQLKICDPAMGSGAFLVAACRELASEIVASWTRLGQLAAVIEKYGDAHLHARRLVAQQCLYGVDKNAAAVELAKLSLWLVTLSRQLPFTFVDHALRHGDSLVGLDFKQIEAFHWTPPGQAETIRVLLSDALDQAVNLRQQILGLAEYEDAISQAEKRRLFEFSQQAVDRVRIVADACVGAFFSETKDAAREKERKRRLALVEQWIGGGEKANEARLEVEALAQEARKQLIPFHWSIEFPEVFYEERPDPLQGGVSNGVALMDAFVGNPPFSGKNGIVALGDGYLEYLLRIHESAHGNADLSAHFFRRAACLLGAHGAVGLIATNTISQGDTRATGLQHLLTHDGFAIYDAVRTLTWPGAAAVVVSLVHLAKGSVLLKQRDRCLDGEPVLQINSKLRSGPESADPVALQQNVGLTFTGVRISGAGFVLTPEERIQAIATDLGSSKVIAPLLGGEEANSDPRQQPHRFVINFGRRSLPEAAEWPDLLARLERLVKPLRDAVRENVGKGGHGKKYWWQFVDRCDPLYDALATCSRCLVTANVARHHVLSWQPTSTIFANSLCVFALDNDSAFATLQSRIHQAWARLHCATLKEDSRYNPSRAFYGFGFPNPDPRTPIPELESIGAGLYAARAKFMVETGQGLTKTYNALKDPACDDPRVLDLRALHEEMDRAVLSAYRWNVPVPSYCPKSDADRATIQAFEDEVIDRLYLLNAERAQEEQRLGLGAKRKATRAGEDGSDEGGDVPVETTGTANTKGRGRKASDDQKKLF